MYKIDFSNRARRELLDSYRWYEDQQDRLGDRFEKAIYTAAQKVAKAPEMYAVRYRNFRQIQLKKFPFLLVFQIKKDTILITSVFHTKRNPANKYK